MANLDSMERIWFDQRKFEDAERKLVEHVANQHESLVVEVNHFSILTYRLGSLLF